MLEARAISKRFGGQTVLRGVNLTVAPGEVVGLVGMNGSGKTTLLDVLMGKVHPDGGEVWFDGQNVAPWRAFTTRPPMFRSYQVPRLFYGLSVGNNVLLGRWALGEKYASFDPSLSLLTSDALAETLSIGQRRRVVLDWVRARIGRIKYFLLDEPAAGADDLLVDHLLDLLEVARGHGCGVLLVEHRDGVLRSACDRIVYLRDGVCSSDPSTNGFEAASLPTVQSGHLDETGETPRLTIEELSVARGGALVLSGVNLKLNPGGVVVVTGPNGCGKSTLLKAVYGDPSCSVVGGGLMVGGSDLSTLSLRQRISIGIHLMPQDGALFPSMSVEEALRTSVEAARPRNWNVQAVKDVRRELPILNKIWRRRCGLLSGGERRIVSLARILLLQPSIALLDEPLAGLDAQSTMHIVRVLNDQRSKGTALLIAEQAGLLKALPHDSIIELSLNREGHEGIGEILPKIPHALTG